MKKYIIFALSIGLAISTVAAENTQVTLEESKLDEIYVTGGQEEILTTPGSAYLLDKTQLEKFEYTDIHRVLGSVPGVYMRTEDGYGLRPNIGMRGAPAERSQKISIMEDGILIGPAPYSAPAAYYFPNVARMDAIEVFKGPVSIKYGPNTVGGAINMITTAIPEEFQAEVEATGGSFQFYKLQANVGDNKGNIGWLAEALSYGSEGFKELNSGEETGFQRNDVNLKLRYTTPTKSKYYQRFDLKLGYADEGSDETYLGLTDEDFQATPYRRYAASQLDKVITDHQQLHVTHFIELSNRLNLTTRAYQNNFNRSWNKFEDFRRNTDNPTDPFTNATYSISEVLDNPTGVGEAKYYNLLTGATDSNGEELQKLDITDNDRAYVSRGIELSANMDLMHGTAIHELEAGIRLHNDYVDRNHTVKTYDMIGGNLVADNIARSPRLKDNDKTYALALYLKDKIFLDEWTMTAGLRGELIRSTHKDNLNASNNNVDYTSVIIPGLGAFYQYTESLGFLIGVNKGFAPNGPSAVDDVDPEESINTEMGFRYQQGVFNAEVVGFYNRYSNLIGRCRVSDVDCTVGEEFNGGKVDIVGAEVSSNYATQLGAWKLPVGLTYTYTDSAFQHSFSSGFSQWGDVIAGDELPYLPQHQLRLEFGLSKAKWDLSLAVKYTSTMREKAGQGNINDESNIPEYSILDFATSYQLSKSIKLQMAIDNVLDEVSVVSRRPFGARPNKPRSFMATVKYGI